jgi:4-hydroxy-tetrahydrodipicolinate reductase
VLDSSTNRDGAALKPGTWPGVDVAIDFSAGTAVEENLTRLASLGINAVIGTTGWDSRSPGLRAAVARAGIGVVAAPNFSTGMLLFTEIVRRAGSLLGPRPEYGAWIHELHHAAKRDAPSGTALALERTLAESGYDRPVNMASTRAGSIPGTHTAGFDSPSDTITLTHTVRDRGAFARGALVAAAWLKGRSGWFTMYDCLGLTREGQS